ncbi:aldo/keto reductase [Streptosporangium sp. NPDC006007]|uniref:aldo/keto reductase n=1 Tax=Streptosporangium sp. NPDC006007 TaxID=3154575 RepID=UPI00339F94A4
MTYVAADDRYDGRQPYNRVGRSGLKLPAVSLGLWHNFGDDKPFEIQRAILRRASVGHFLTPEMLTAETMRHVRTLNEIAGSRGQSLAQMALAWALRDSRVTSVLIGASSVRQLENSLGAVRNLSFGAEELEAIDRDAVEAGLNLWTEADEA